MSSGGYVPTLRGPLLILAFICIIHLVFFASDMLSPTAAALTARPLLKRLTARERAVEAACKRADVGWGAVRAPRVRVGPAGSRGRVPRVVFLMLDNRGVAETREEASYTSVAAVANYLYAQRHGYDFALLSPAALDAAAEGSGLGKGACTHVGRGAVRGLTWCKVLALWAASAAGPPPRRAARGSDADENDDDAWDARFDYMVYIDSDAVVHRPFAPLSDAWLPGSGNLAFGGPFGEDGDPAEGRGPILFFYSDRQQRGWALANMGFIVARNGPALRPMLREWWNDNSSYYDMHPHFEQQAFWNLQEGPRTDSIAAHVTVSDAQWAPWDRAQWLVHVNSEENWSTRGEARAKFFPLWLDILNVTADVYEEIREEMYAACAIVDIDLAALSEDIYAAGTGAWGGGEVGEDYVVDAARSRRVLGGAG